MHVNMKQKKSLFSFWVPHLYLRVRGLQALFGEEWKFVFRSQQNQKLVGGVKWYNSYVCCSWVHSTCAFLCDGWLLPGPRASSKLKPLSSKRNIKTLWLSLSNQKRQQNCVAMASLLLPLPLGDLVVVSKMEKQNSWEYFCNVTFLFLARFSF